MITLAVLATIAGLHALTTRLGALALWSSARRDHEILYDDSNYARRDAPHGDDWLVGALIALAFPISLPILLAMKAFGAFNGGTEQRWKQRRAHLAEMKAEQARLTSIVEELNRQYTNRTPDA